MLDHLELPVRDVEASVRFYLDVFASLGLREARRRERDGMPVVGLSGPDGFPRFWLARPSMGLTMKFTSRLRLRTARPCPPCSRGSAGKHLHPPRVWPEYHPSYYGVFLRDLDGNNVEAVCHS